ncbi:protein involved in polysaccharide export with SLBB domain [Allofrancisella inopinata]|uniref:Sugar ABC transporter substrate-binding protein n=1 Tax=Allofrancisella inopinata TaxID=1085647 RepID=A0AAE6YIH2_9GAMM|nr:polysaccharide biosynthesis/export family protein [Allofrancisella inopinata]QIV96508.1 sugar ABC transporter substrate-binding protein [Allofrancisella inopinata]TDT68497.1 protein involved in polysaccharide export with SLBB domain [Allofrancisella inopinata]
MKSGLKIRTFILGFLLCCLFFIPLFTYAEVGLLTQQLAEDAEGNFTAARNGNQKSKDPTENIPTPPPIIQDQAGGKYSNKVLDVAHLDQLGNLQVFGENLFSHQCLTLPKMAFYNPDYLISPGDNLSLSLWGAYEYVSNSTVDSQGNIFIPKVGPVKVANTPNKELNDVVSTALKRTFKNNVVAYANLLGAQPVQVFVTGYVANPGLYDGMSSDSILYFLCKAGGIIPEQGSFRKVDLVRKGQVIASIDLYDFLLKGTIPFSQLHQGDSIVVRPKADSVTVLGEVKVPAMYEPYNGSFGIKQLIKLAGVKPNATYVLIEDSSGVEPTNNYIALSDITNQTLKPGEKITLMSDQNIKELTVSINGAIFGPHQFVVPIGTTLEDIVGRLKFRSDANRKNLQLFRESVAAAQKAAINSNLDYLEQQAYTKSSLTKDGLIMQQQYAGLVSSFVAKARQVQPKGQVIVGPENRWEHIALQNNDVINIPNKNQVITISGQIMSPMAVNYNEKFSIEDYIKLVGGYTPSADKGYIILLHENGIAEQVNLGFFSSLLPWSVYPQPGDQIIVPNEGMSEALPILATISQIVFQIAIAARVFIAPF